MEYSPSVVSCSRNALDLKQQAQSIFLRRFTTRIASLDQEIAKSNPISRFSSICQVSVTSLQVYNSLISFGAFIDPSRLPCKVRALFVAAPFRLKIEFIFCCFAPTLNDETE